MKPFNLIVLISILSMLVLTFLYGVGPTMFKGFSLKNIILYGAVISLLFVRRFDFYQILKAPGIFFLFLILAWAIVGIFFIPFTHGGHQIDRFFVMTTIKGQLFDPILLYAVGFILGITDKKNTSLFQFYIIFFGVLNVIALSVFFTGLNPFKEAVFSARGTRFSSFGGLSNHAAYMLTFFFIYFYYFFFNTKSRSFKILFLALLSTTVTGVLLTGSRGGYLLFAAIILFIVFWQKQNKKFLMVIVGATALAFGFGYLLDSEFLVNALGRLSLLTSDQEMTYRQIKIGYSSQFDVVSSGRTWIWRNAFKILFNDPLSILVGKGWGTFNSHMQIFTGTLAAVHNVPIKVLFEGGIVAFLIGIAFIKSIMQFYYSTVFSQDKKFYFIIMCSIFIIAWYFMLSDAVRSFTTFSLGFGILNGHIIRIYDRKPDVIQ